MREVKFRAWDGKSIIDVPINHSGYRLNELLEGICDNYQLMQYTGLKDKNNIDIYEGDIVITCGVREYPSLVKWFSGGWIGWQKPDENGNGQSHTLPRSELLEIVGNIYENPELLEANHD